MTSSRGSESVLLVGAAAIATLAIVVAVALIVARLSPAPSLEVFRAMASSVGGVAKGRHLYPRLVFPLDGGSATLAHHWASRTAATRSPGGRDRFVTFTIASEPLRARPDLIVLTAIGWTTTVQQVGFERRQTGDDRFDRTFVVWRRPAVKTAALDEPARRLLLALKQDTPVLEVSKVGPELTIKYQLDRLGGVDETRALLDRLVEVSRAVL